MSFFSGIGEAIVRPFISTVSTVASAIGGAVSAGVNRILPVIGIPGPIRLGLHILAAIVTHIIPKIAEILVDKPKTETPEELGMKAELAKKEENLSSEDFNSTEEYIKYLREEIHIDKEKLQELSDEDRRKYAVTGAGLYISRIEEQYGVELKPEFLTAVARADMKPERVSHLILALQEAGIKDGAAFDSYLAGRLEPGSDALLSISQVHEKALSAELGTDDPEQINAAILLDKKNYDQDAGLKEIEE